jgi:ABC-2 type transport system ATP-binding protein
MGEAIAVSDLRKSYGDVQAVAGVSLAVQKGEIFGMVGPNGAGKTTTIECIEGLRKPDGGSVTVLGLDPQRHGYQLRERIGVQLQETALADRIKVDEAMDLFSSFYQRAVDWDPLLEQLGLADKRAAYFGRLSGGQKQRLFIALALVSDPEIVFLDELTTGLDPQARRAMWELVKGIRERGKTVFLTTHYMEEAEQLCDRVAIIDDGKLVALDTPAELVRQLGVENSVVFTAEDRIDLKLLQDLPIVTKVEERAGSRIVVSGKEEGLVGSVVNALEDAGIAFRDLRTEQPSLEDVFLALTGREMRE